MPTPTGETGRTDLARLAMGDDPDRSRLAAEVVAEVGQRRLHTVRLAFTDQHGVLRGKALRADLLAGVMDNGVGITSALLLKDSGQINVFPVWDSGAGLDQPAMTGAGDVVMLPDPTTFRSLPWADGTGWILCDLVTPTGEPVPFSTRQLCARAYDRLADAGYALRSGLEIEFHLYHLTESGSPITDTRGAADQLRVGHTHPGWMYLGEQRLDRIEPLLDVLRRDLTELGLAPRSMEIELGPSQVELTFSPDSGLKAADHAVLVRSAVKQIAQRHDLHATFMSRPNIADSFSSGWHLHQSLVDTADGTNLFVPTTAKEPLSDLGRHYLCGLLDHAAESCLLTTPTITGYKRCRPDPTRSRPTGWPGDANIAGRCSG